MAHVNGLGEMIVGVEVLFERQDIAEAVEVASHGFYAPFLPGPKLRGDIVDVFEAVFVGELCNSEIKTGVVDEDNGVGTILEDVLFA